MTHEGHFVQLSHLDLTSDDVIDVREIHLAEYAMHTMHAGLHLCL